MKLLKFRIRNYRSCQLTTLSPNSGLTALIGVNGSGKSNLLSAILLLKRATRGSTRHIQRVDDEYVNRSYVNAEIDYNGHLISLRGDVFYSTNNQNIDEVVETKLKWNLESITGKEGYTFDRERIEKLDTMRHDIVHGYGPIPSLPDPGVEVSYATETCMFFVGMVNNRYNVKLWPPNMTQLPAKKR